MENLGSCNRYKERVYTKKEEGVSIIKGRKGRGVRVHIRATEERIYPTFKVAANSVNILCRKEGW